MNNDPNHNLDPLGLVKWVPNHWNYEYSEHDGIVGKVLKASTDDNTPIDIWQTDEAPGKYWCHGYTFGGNLAGGQYPYSTWGDQVDKIINGDKWIHICCSMAGAGDIAVFRDSVIEHSGRIKTIAHAGNAFDEQGGMIASKHGLPAGVSSDSFAYSATRYHSTYKCYTKQPKVGCCAKKGSNETPP